MITLASFAKEIDKLYLGYVALLSNFQHHIHF